jgi:hypothetical protein
LRIVHADDTPHSFDALPKLVHIAPELLGSNLTENPQARAIRHFRPLLHGIRKNRACYNRRREQQQASSREYNCFQSNAHCYALFISK